MTKQDFVDAVADRAGLSKRDAATAVDAMLETITAALICLVTRYARTGCPR